MKTNIFLMHDGIKNSVFHGQILNPLVESASSRPKELFILISFESKKPNIKLDVPKNLEIKILHKSKFLKLSTLKLKPFINANSVVARGPVAGWMAIKAGFKNITIQARGILTEEYELAHLEDKGLKKIVSWLRAAYYRQLERFVYSNNKIKIEAVSTALKKFLHKKYYTNLDNINIAKLDIPKPIETAKLVAWKSEVRKELAFSEDDYIACYAGSVKPWQHPKDVVPFLKIKLTEKPNCKLLILTQDKAEFETYIKEEGINPTQYKVASSNHSDIYKYLAAANVGVIYRNKHIVNWVSRPTKALEYKAAGLEVIHNNTVDFLNKTF